MSVIISKAREDELPIADLCREAYQEMASNMTAEDDRADQLARVSDVETALEMTLCSWRKTRMRWRAL